MIAATDQYFDDLQADHYKIGIKGNILKHLKNAIIRFAPPCLVFPI